MCVHVVIFSLLHVPDVWGCYVWRTHDFVAATSSCDMLLRNNPCVRGALTIIILDYFSPVASVAGGFVFFIDLFIYFLFIYLLTYLFI